MDRINCESLIVDPKNAELVLEYLPDGETLDGLCGLFSALGDGTRLKILSALSITALCVGDIVKLLGLNQTTVSHQLAALRIAGAVKSGCAFPPSRIHDCRSNTSLTRFMEACALVNSETILEMTIIALRICAM